MPDDRLNGGGCLVGTGDERNSPDRGRYSGSQYTWAWWAINASKSNGLYGSSSTVQPPAIQILIIIKIWKEGGWTVVLLS